MFRTLARACAFLAASLIVVAAFAPRALAQAPKPGPYYEDKTDLNFKVQIPSGWKFVPPQPNDMNLIGKYVTPNGSGLITRQRGVWTWEVHLIKFDRRNQSEDGSANKKPRRGGGGGGGAENAKEYVENQFGGYVDGWHADGEKKLKLGKLDATEYEFAAKLETDQKEPVRVYVMVVKLLPDVDVALLANGPGDEKKWGRYEDAFQSMGRSFRAIEGVAPSAAAKPVGNSLRDQKRAKLQDDITRLPGWKLYESENYFVLSNSPDTNFLHELMDRLEAIRKLYEETYTAKEALELRKKALAIAGARTDGGASTKPAQDGNGGAPPPADPRGKKGPQTEEEMKASLEASRACVVRVCTDAEMYHNYGGPSGSAGYWNSSDEELVIYDDQKSGGRSNTWKTMNHEAFHQYMYYFYGNIAPHSWYNEGGGDFYAGYTYNEKSKQFTLKPFDWRVQEVKDMNLPNTKVPFVPLSKFVRYSQAEYYGSNKDNATVGNNYAQGWALIYFLRGAPKKFKGWNPAWNSILPKYLETLVMTSDLKQAVDKAFEGVDIDGAFTEAWKAYLKQEL